MTKYKSSGVLESASNARRGLKIAFFSQRNFVIETIISICVFTAGILLKFSISDLCILILISSLVLISELINSAIENTLDAVYKNKYSILVKNAKDISAGMVMTVCIISAVLGVLLFGSYIFKLI